MKKKWTKEGFIETYYDLFSCNCGNIYGIYIYNNDNVITILIFLAAQFLFGLFPIPNSQEIDITFRFRVSTGLKRSEEIVNGKYHICK